MFAKNYYQIIKAITSRFCRLNNYQNKSIKGFSKNDFQNLRGLLKGSNIKKLYIAKALRKIIIIK